MCLRSLLSVSLLSSALPLLSMAQTTPATSKFSLGLTGTYATYDAPSRYIPTLIAGLQLTPRLAVQLGVGYTWRKLNYGGEGRYFDSQTNEFHNEVGYTEYRRLLTAPLSLRYTVTPLAKRWQLDVVGGATALYYLGRYDETFSTATQPRRTVTKDSYDHLEGLLSLGLGLRYVLTPRVELVGDALVNTAWNNPFNGYIRSYPSSFSLGARYRFGTR